MTAARTSSNTALLMALIAVTAIAGVRTLGATINSVFWNVIANYR